VTGVQTCALPIYFVLANLSDQLALDDSGVWFQRQGVADAGARTLVYTDRSIYRPSQKLYWKLVTYRGSDQGKRFQVQPGAALTLDLLDPNGEKVASTKAVSNGFGSAAGEFIIPAGRLLGAWRLSASPSGQAAVRVEEYKRPTFEVAFQDPAGALRLNRPAELQGEAKYYFGLPLVNGSIQWRVTREPVYPSYWDWFGWPRGQSQTIATGTATLDEAGRFSVHFTPEADERDSSQRELSYRYQVTADVTDEGGETRSASRSLRLGWVSLEAKVAMDGGFFLERGDNRLNLSRADLNGAPRAGAASWTLAPLRQPETALLPADQPLPPRPQAADAYRTPGDWLRPRWDSAANQIGRASCRERVS
jgi:hypothetical protein